MGSGRAVRREEDASLGLSWKTRWVFASCRPSFACEAVRRHSLNVAYGAWAQTGLFCGLKDEKPTRTVQKAHVGVLIHVADGSSQVCPVLPCPVPPAADGHPGDTRGGGLCTPHPKAMVAVPWGPLLTLVPPLTFRCPVVTWPPQKDLPALTSPSSQAPHQ